MMQGSSPKWLDGKVESLSESCWGKLGKAE